MPVLRALARGIAPEVRGHLFEAFFTTKQVGQGTGLGLSLMYEIVKKHEGVISVDTEVNKGTTFTIALPLQQAPAGGSSHGPR
ncbi:MAG TPA: ATP-binding protein [Elusimicrobiota bacterium]|nr:ATP-binding protein [Elusimicrobiota bacterium]